MNRRTFLTASAGTALLARPPARLSAAPQPGSGAPEWEKPVFDLHKTVTTPVKIAAIDLLQSGNRFFLRTRSTDGAEGIVRTKDMEDFIPILQAPRHPALPRQCARCRAPG